VPDTTINRLRVHQNWAGDVPLKFLWTVHFDGREGNTMDDVGSNIKNVINQYEGNSFPVKPDVLTDFSHDDMGVLLAQNAALPNEQITIGTESLGNTGGFRAGYFAAQRSVYGSQNKLDITFLETNIDLMDYFIKPWVIATSYKGLIEDDEDDIKCFINLTLYSRSDVYYKGDKNQTSNNFNRDMVVDYTPRKMYTFYDSAPFNIEGGQLSYNSELSLDEITKTISFTFSHYQVRDVNQSVSGASRAQIVAESPVLGPGF